MKCALQSFFAVFAPFCSQSSATLPSIVFNLDSDVPLRLGTGMNAPFNGQLSCLQIHRRAVAADEIATFARQRPER